MKKFYILIGNIGSGKSTYIRNNLSTGVVINKDSIRYGLGGGKYLFDLNLEPIVHSTSIYLTRKLCENETPILILDETNVIRKGRKSFIKIAKEYGYKVIALNFPYLEKKEAVDRRMTNPHDQPDRKIWEGVWSKFNRQYQEPFLTEGYDEIIQISKKEIS